MNFPENLTRLLRMQNTFDPSNQPDDGPSTSNVSLPSFPMQSNIPEYDQNDQYAPNLPPNNPIQDRLSELLNTFPERNKPGIGRKLGASLVSLGMGPQYADDVLYGPYNRQLADWKTKAGVVGDVAKHESTFGRLANSKDALAERTAARTEGNQIKQGRLALDEWKSRHPNHVFKDTKGGNVIAFDPQNPGMPIDTGIATGTLTDKDKIDYQVSGQERLEDKRQSGRVSLADRNFQNRSILQDDAQANQSDLFNRAESGRNSRFNKGEAGRQSRFNNKTSTTGAGTKTSDTQMKQRYITNAMKMIQDDPSLKEWISFDPDTKLPVIKDAAVKPGFLASWGGAKTTTDPKMKQKRDMIYAKIYGSDNAPIDNSNKNLPEKVRVRNKKTGQTGTMNRVELEKSPGFEEIK